MRNPNALHGHSVMEILQMLDSWALHSPEDEVRHLWAVLSALRGPDNGDTVLKSQTTAWVRAAAVPWMAGMAGASVAKRWNPDQSGDQVIRDMSPLPLKSLERLYHEAEDLEKLNEAEISVHFIRHIQLAFAALKHATSWQEMRDGAAKKKGVVEGEER